MPSRRTRYLAMLFGFWALWADGGALAGAKQARFMAARGRAEEDEGADDGKPAYSRHCGMAPSRMGGRLPDVHDGAHTQSDAAAGGGARSAT